jgi:hypothetical protein
MGNNGDKEEKAKRLGFRKFATPRVIGGIAIAIVVLWALSAIFGTSDEPTSTLQADKSHRPTTVAETSRSDHQADKTEGDHTTAPAPVSHAKPAGSHATADTHTPAASHESPASHEAQAEHQTAATGSETHTAPAAHATAETHERTAHEDTAARKETSHEQPRTAAHTEEPAAHGTAEQAAEEDTHGGRQATATKAHKPTPRGVAFVEAAMQPMKYELEERWWGWRPNDIIDITDNVNYFQLGVLEVTRRTIVALAERISRHGVTDSLDPNLEEAMNWFMVKASSYWFPSAESKYRDGLEEMSVYLEKLKTGRATFYIRSDNLIPLLASFEDLLGSCDENLVKQTSEDGTPVGFFAVDNYFFYTRGVASAMATVLEAVHHDFLPTLESRNATELLHHAVVSCKRAAEIDPWIVLDRNLGSIFANHRANMAAPISHARFYLGQLVKTLST